MGHSVHPRPRQGAIGREKTAVRQVARARRSPVQPYRSDDIGRHVGAGCGRRPSISRRIVANSRRGIATSASWNVTYRPCRTILAPILISFSRSVSDFRLGSPPDQRHRHPESLHLGVQPTKSGRKRTSALECRLLGVERSHRRPGPDFSL